MILSQSQDFLVFSGRTNLLNRSWLCRPVALRGLGVSESLVVNTSWIPTRDLCLTLCLCVFYSVCVFVLNCVFETFLGFTKKQSLFSVKYSQCSNSRKAYYYFAKLLHNYLSRNLDCIVLNLAEATIMFSYFVFNKNN